MKDRVAQGCSRLKGTLVLLERRGGVNIKTLESLNTFVVLYGVLRTEYGVVVVLESSAGTRHCAGRSN